MVVCKAGVWTAFRDPGGTNLRYLCGVPSLDQSGYPPVGWSTQLRALGFAGRKKLRAAMGLEQFRSRCSGFSLV